MRSGYKNLLWSQQDLKEQVYFENLQMITQVQHLQQFNDPNHQILLLNGRAMDNETIEMNLRDNADQDVTVAEAEAEEVVDENDPQDTSMLTGETWLTRTSKANIIAGSLLCLLLSLQFRHLLHYLPFLSYLHYFLHVFLVSWFPCLCCLVGVWEHLHCYPCFWICFSVFHSLFPRLQDSMW